MKETLKFCPICANVSEATIDKILELATVSVRQGGLNLYSAGGRFTGFYVLKSGNIRLSISSEDGKEILVKSLEGGDVFGQTGLLEGRYLETAYLMAESEFIFLSEKAISEILLESPELSKNLLISIGHWTMEFYLRFKTLSLPSAKDRVIHYLLSELRGSSTKFSLKLKRHEIASNLGIRPETLSRVLSELQTKDLIEIENNILIIKNIENLTD